MKPHRFESAIRILTNRRAKAANSMQASAAQNATPAASPETVAVSDTPPVSSQLFVQAFQSGSIAPSTSVFGTHTITLAQGFGQTIVFTDRPSREVFTTRTPAFLDGLGFPADNPPNAAILMDAADGTTDIAVVELFNPTYDETTRTATYDIAVLANWQNDLELGFQEEPADLSNVPVDFGAAHLFIDGCGGEFMCVRVKDVGLGGEPVGYLPYVPATYWWDRNGCIPDGTADTHTLDEVNALWDSACNKYFDSCDDRCFILYVSRNYEYP